MATLIYKYNMSSSQTIDEHVQIAEAPRVHQKRPNRKVLLESKSIGQFFREDVIPSPLSKEETIPVQVPQPQPLSDIERNIDAFANFSAFQFMEAFAYHIIFFFLIGPFIGILMRLVHGNTMLYQNMGFNLGLRVGPIMQTSIWLLNVALYFLYAQSEYQASHRSEFIFTQLFMLFRCVMISARYGSFSAEKLRLFKTFPLTSVQIGRDFYLGEWADQTPRIIYNEIQGTITRHQLDRQLFHFYFLVDPLIETAERLVQHNINLSEYHLSDTEYEPQSHFTYKKFNVNYFYGFGIVAEFIEIYRRRSKNYQHRINWIAMAVCLVTIAIPYMQRWETNDFYWSYDTATLIPMTILIWLNLSIVVKYNLTAIVDLMRKNFLLAQCASLMSAQKKLQLTDVKTLPTINIFCFINLKAWSILRRVCLEYGYNYFLRAQILFTVEVLTILAGLITFILDLSGVIDIESTFFKMFSVCFVYCFVVSLMMLYLAAAINSYFRTFQNTLCQNKLLISEMSRMQPFYMQNECVPRNYVTFKGLQMILQYFPRLELDLEGYFDNAKQAYDEAIEALLVHSKDPFTMLGIEINSGSFSSYVITIGSILSTLLGSMIANMIKP